VSGNDHTRAEAVQWALKHAEAAEGCDQALRFDSLGAVAREGTLADMHRNIALAGMWASIARAMPVD
jgi:hypothetical protein